MRKATIFIVLAFLLAFCAAPAYANGIPGLPHAFYGSVTINDDPAPDGTQISATVNIGDIIATQNPVTTVGGSYGIDSLYLLVQGYDIPDEATITFYVTDENGTAIGDETATFEAGGGPTRHDLLVTIPAPAPSGRGGGGGGALIYYIETDLFGIEASFRISDEGEITETITATSEDGNLTITIPEGTIALDKDGDRLSSLTTDVDPSPPAPPEDANIIGLAFDFGPDGATFDPGITFEYTYDPAELPGGVAEADLVIAFYDAEAGEWVTCDCTCDPEANCITACVCHFTTFAIIGAVTPPPPVAPPPPPEEEEVAPAPPEEEEVAPAPPPPPPPEEEVVPAPAPINWPLIGGIIAAVVVAALLIYFLVVRRRAY